MSQTDPKRLTPMLAQYKGIKARFPDAVVLFRLGDFYETFDADAKIAARELDLVLTSRSFAKGVRLPMAGVPYHHVQSYIARLIEKGYKVALVEQLEDPKKVKHLVKRDVVRIITPGTVVEDALLHAEAGNYLAAIVRSGLGYGLALADISTGEFATTQIDGAEAQAKLLDELQRVQASEYVLPQSLAADTELGTKLSAVRPARISPIEDAACGEAAAREELIGHFHVAALDAFGCEGLPLAIQAAGAILYYLKSNQPNGGVRGGAAHEQRPFDKLWGEAARQDDNTLTHLNHLWTYSLADYMTLDAATRRNLELITPIHSPPSDLDNFAQRGTAATRSLFGVLNYTATAMGARLLKRWLSQPLLDLAQIEARLDAVQELVRDSFLRADLLQLLDGVYDVERLVGRIGFGNANARDLMALKQVLGRLPRTKARLGATHSARLQELGGQLEDLSEVEELIGRAIREDPPIFVREGGLIRSGYDATLDELRTRVTQGKGWLSELEEKERVRTGIKSLRVRYNEVFGFFIEVPRSAGHLIPKEYERRATISHAERYVTPELKAQEAQILAAEDRVKDLEYDLFVQVRRQVARHADRLLTAARILAQVDALCSFAQAAARMNYCKPHVDDGDTIEIREGRHPVVERFLQEGENFVPNDVHLDGEARVIILTGPNMSGKSVFVRQVALIVLMAQVGSFVPAREAHIGLADRIFTRVGASDDIAQGRSTFLVEMSETSHILRHATPRSLIVLDEVGRGTSTYDGISLAWAIAEEIHNVIGAKTLFATHYHELTQLESSTAIVEYGGAVRNYTMAVKELPAAPRILSGVPRISRDAVEGPVGGGVVFLRQVIPGRAEKSFGIHVARLAGLPARVIERAEEVLHGLEGSRGNDPTSQLPNEPRGSEASGSEGAEGQPRKDRGASEGGRGAWERPDASPEESELVGSERGVVREEQALYRARAELWRQILRQVAETDIANMTPIQALNLLNEMQVRIRQLDSRLVG